MERFWWLTDRSELFMQRGYLRPGVTPVQRFKQIADYAEAILGKEGFSDKFMEYLSMGFYSLSSPIVSNFGANRGLGISCLTGDAWIHTEHEGGTQIKDLKIGDKVLTHKHRFKQVTDIQSRMSTNDIYELKVQTRLTPIKITGNHPILTNMGWVRVDELDENVHLIATPASEISRNVSGFTMNFDKWNFPENDSNGGAKFQRQILNSVDINEEIAWSFGLWFGDGSLAKQSSGNPSGIRITASVGERTQLERFLEIYQTIFGVNGNIYESTASGRVKKDGINPKWLTLNVNSSVLGNWFLENFGEHFDGKNIPIWLKNLPQPLLKAFYEGFYQADGKKQGQASYITIANPKLAMSLFEIGLNCNFNMGLQMQEKAGKLSSTKYVYRVITYCKMGKRLDLNRFSASSGIMWSDGLRYCPFKLKKLSHNETVYDITVEEDHSFAVSGVIVHNCFGSYPSDSMDRILYTNAEIGMMSKHGGGTSAFFGEIRPRGSKISTGGESEGSVNFMEMFETTINVTKQSDVRRGAMAVYLPIDHGDILEFLEIREPEHPIQTLFPAVCVPNYWMEEMIAGDEEKRAIWIKVLQSRNDNGVPYIFFTDNVNDFTVDVYRDQNYKIHASNLCSEIALPSNDFESFVCDLSSMNAYTFDYWRHTDAVETLVYFLDAVMTDFINKASKIPFLERAVNFAQRHRALGIGVLGWHSYLQSKMIPFDSMDAMYQNAQLFKTIQDKAWNASESLAKEYGEPEVLEGYGRRNTTLTSVAPTTSSSFIFGQVSQSIEPYMGNVYIKALAKIEEKVVNPNIVRILSERRRDVEADLKLILDNEGSIQKFDFFTDEEKEVFKTFSETSHKAIINQATQRQKWIDQSQSLNFKIHPDTPVKDINNLIIEFWQNGGKTLYYQHSTNAAQELNRDLMTCSACE